MPDHALAPMSLAQHARFSVAPMMAWTDRHCRWFHRQLSQRALLYTEMVTAAALVHGDASKLLEHSAQEHPVAVQLGGSDPALLKAATQICIEHGFVEVNLNCGCPSDRVQSGAFGAVLMKDPALVARCVEAMMSVQGAEITVKCRIGVDDQIPADVLVDFLGKLQMAGISRVTVHARMAWLQGLSPKENRDIPPLDYPLVFQMKREFPELHISLNGGVTTIDQACDLLGQGIDGVMVGRSAYHQPFDILAEVDQRIFGLVHSPDAFEIADRLGDYILAHMNDGGRMHHVTRHILGLFHGMPGARHWRRGLSNLGADPSATRWDYDNLVKTVQSQSTLQPQFVN